MVLFVYTFYWYIGQSMLSGKANVRFSLNRGSHPVRIPIIRSSCQSLKVKMTAHIHPLALPTIAGVWDGPHTNFSLGQESQENGKCAPPPNFPHTSNSQHGPSRNRLQAQITELLLHHHDEIRVAVEFFKGMCTTG